MSIPGFTEEAVTAAGVPLNVAAAGSGSPILLLHGFPETHLAWRHVAPALAERHRVICPDLPGYGASGAPGDSVEAHSKRNTATIMVELMRQLGHERFALVGHDRGALVAYRAALDHPDVVTHVGMIDVIPAQDMWASLTGVAGAFAFHLYLLAQPSDLPERMIGADPDLFFGHFIDGWAPEPTTIPPDVRAAYLDAARAPAAIHAICQDYRAGAFVDPQHDTDDRKAGRTIDVPALAIWQDPGDMQLPFDPEAVWRSWAPDLRTAVLPGGHFLPEARPSDVTRAIGELLDARA
ncbi:alpha/beta fold hydrolase [Pseudonocardia sp. TRM90224]|uniref:alpha/beta fold hydrolase n=1 Tax=Pseudonocardia sp. TRM90224 TaxID=2812678 RepID=UPI001E46E067|nr:alpha/beta hydrolase [Pseudonocardia sp. TRM90224]